MMRDTLFEAAPFFLLRIPLWSTDNLEALYKKDNPLEAGLELFEESPFLREAILAASPTLYRQLQGTAQKNREELASSLFNYIIRLCTRPTPFGLFSCVTFGEWCKETKAEFDPSKVYKKVRPDAEWIFSLLNTPCKTLEQLSAQSIRANPFIRFEGGKCTLNDIIELKREQDKEKTISINANPIVQSILKRSAQKVYITDLLEGLYSEFPDLDRDKTLEVIQTLLAQQFLLPGELPSLLGKNIYQHLLPEKLPKKIAALSETLPGESEKTFLQVSEEMKLLAKTETPLQVDTAYSANTLCIGASVQKEIEKTLSLWWQVSTALNPPSHLSEYLNIFTEKYGTQRTVPLREVLCETRGIGDPFSQPSRSTQSPPSTFVSLWEALIQKKWQGALKDNSKEIEIIEDELEDLFSSCEKEKLSKEDVPAAFDAFFKVFASSQEALDQGDFLLQFSDFNWQVGSSFGRFLELFDEKPQEALKKVIKRAESQQPDACYAEVSFWPQKARLGNVVTIPYLRDYRIDLFGPASKKNLSLEEIYVGSTGKRFYFTLRNGQQELIPTFGNFLNPLMSPTPIRFLREALYPRGRFIYPFSFKRHVPQAIFTPRVRIGKTIVSVAKWYLEGQPFQKKSLKEIQNQFSAWAKQWSLPERVEISVGDQKLQLNRKSSHGLDLIIQTLSKGKSLELSESLTSSWLQSSQGNHNTEIVVPLQKNAHLPQNPKSIRLYPFQEVSLEERIKLPGSDWIYYKIYLENETMDQFLVQHLAPIGSYFCQEGIAKKWHFLRYNDPDCHFRFRMQLNHPEDLSKVIPPMEPIIQSWIKGGLVKEVQIGSYEREVERYGGSASLEVAETVFHLDSEVVFQLILALITKEIPISSESFRSLCVIHFLKQFLSTDKEILEFITMMNVDNSYLKGYRSYKSEISEALNFPPPALICSFEKIQMEYSSLHPEILTSLLHIHCNRLGCSRFEENQAYRFAQKALQEKQRLMLVERSPSKTGQGITNL